MEKILIVEDDEKIARVVQLELEFEEYEVDIAYTGKEALEKYGPCPIHRKSFAPVLKAMQKQMSFDF